MIATAMCDALNWGTDTPVKFRMNKETFVEVNPQDGGDPWFTTKREFRQLLRKKEAIRYMVAFSKKVSRSDLKGLVKQKPDYNVQFWPKGDFKIGCMYFNKKEAAKVRKWVRGK